MDDKPEQATVLVIGVGNRIRGDDAAGPSAADNIRSRNLLGVRVIEHSGEGASLMELWDTGDTVFLADAADSGGKPGLIREFEACEHLVPSEFFRYSTHAFGVAEAIELARALGRLPARLHVYAIEGSTFAAGRAMSPEVARAVEVVAERILDRIRIRSAALDERSDICTNSVS